MQVKAEKDAEIKKRKRKTGVHMRRDAESDVGRVMGETARWRGHHMAALRYLIHKMDLTLAEHTSHIISKKPPDPVSVLPPECTKICCTLLRLLQYLWPVEHENKPVSPSGT